MEHDQQELKRGSGAGGNLLEGCPLPPLMTGNSSPYYAPPKHGDCYLTENLVGSAGTLFSGGAPSPISLIDLCVLIEAAVTHEQVLFGGLAGLNNPLSERLRQEGVLRSLLHESNPGASLEADVFFKTFKAAYDLIQDQRKNPWGAALTTLTVRPERAAKTAMDSFKLSTHFSAVKAGLIEYSGTDKAWFDEQVRPGLDEYSRYGEVLASIPRHYEIPILSGACEQSLLDQSRIEIALPHELLVKSYGDHFRQQLGQTFAAIPAPPFAGMVLGAARSLDDIVDKLLACRERYMRYRQTLAQLRDAMISARQAATTRGWMEYQKLQSQVENVISESVKRIEGDFKPKRKLVFRVWDLVKPGNPLKIASNLLDLLIEHDEAKTQVLRVEGVYDVVCAFPDIPFLNVSAERLFGTKFPPESVQTIASGVGLIQAVTGIQDQPA